MKQAFLYFLSLSITAAALSQSCEVKVDSLKGQYTGGCRKGLANGNGTATGIDSYTGDFKNGYPEGEGKYTWKNGSTYEGSWKHGLFDGKGTMFPGAFVSAPVFPGIFSFTLRISILKISCIRINTGSGSIAVCQAFSAAACILAF